MPVRIVVLAMLAAGCGRVGFGDDGGVAMDGGRDVATPDGGTDAPPMDGSGSDAVAGDGGHDAAADVFPDAPPDTSRTEDGGGAPGPVYLVYESVQTLGEAPRTAAAGQLVGDVWLFPAGAGRFDITIRNTPLDPSGAPSREPVVIDGFLTEETPDRFFLEPTDGNPDAVLLVDKSDTRWTFTLDRSDPRSAGAIGEYVDESVLLVSPEPPARTLGNWVAESFESGGGRYATEACVPFFVGFVDASFALDIDPRGRTVARQDIGRYSDAACTAELSRSQGRPRGFVIERPGDRVDGYFWDADMGGITVFYDYDDSIPARLRLARTSCAPDTCPIVDALNLVAAGP